MWETGNSNINNSGKTGNSKSVIELDKVNHAESKDTDVRNISDNLKIRLEILNSLETRSIKKNTRNSNGLGKDPESEEEELGR